MDKKIITILLLCTCFVSSSFAYLQDKVFCTITPNSITVTMDRKNNYKCNEYISVLSQAINKEYNDVLYLQKLVNQGNDVEFWKEVREKKRQQIIKMMGIKQQIEEAILSFESHLFEKMKDYIIYQVLIDRDKYVKALEYLESYQKNSTQKNYQIQTVITYIQEDLLIINDIQADTGYDTIITHYNRHLYLKNKIEGK